MTAEFEVSGCRFIESFSISNWDEGPSLIFKDCIFEKGFSARDAKICRSLSFVRCKFRTLTAVGATDIAVDFENCQITGDLTFFQCRIGGRFFAPSLRAGNDVRLRGCLIASALDDRAGFVRWDEIGLGVSETGVDIVGKLLRRLNWSEKPFGTVSAISLDGGRISGNLELIADVDEARRTGAPGEMLWFSPQSAACIVLGAISAREVRVDGSISVFGTLCRSGYVDFASSRIDGNVSFGSRQTSILNQYHFRTTAAPLLLEGVTIGGDLSLQSAAVDGFVSLHGIKVEGNLELFGLRTAGDLYLTFARINRFAGAFRNFGLMDSSQQPLFVAGDLILSGAEINMLEINGAEIGGDITVRTGKFGRLVFTLGAEPDSSEKGRFWPKPCACSAVEISAVEVDELLDLSGLKVRINDQQQLRRNTRRKGQNDGFSLKQCRIGHDLTFFSKDPVQYLQGRWGDEQPIPWKTGMTPAPEDFKASIWGSMSLEATEVRGNLDLRNADVETDLVLSDMTVRLDTLLGSRHGLFLIDERGMNTSCGHFQADQFSCDGKFDLTGIAVRKEGGRRQSDLSGLKRAGDFSARGARVKGEMLLLPRDTQLPAHAANGKHLEPTPDYAWIEGNMDLTGLEASHLIISSANFKSEEQPSSNASEEEPRLRLERCKLSRLEILKPPPRPIDLSRLAVDRYVFGREQTATADDYIAVLKEMVPFDRSIWINVETALRNQSLDKDANRVFEQMHWKEIANARFLLKESAGWARLKLAFVWCLRWLYGKFLGFGTRSYRLMFLALGFFLLSWLVVFSQPRFVRASPDLLQSMSASPKNADVFAKSGGSHAMELPPTVIFGPRSWTLTDSFVLSLRYHVPIIQAVTHGWWQAGGNPIFGLPLTAEQYAFFISAYSWIAWPVFLIWIATKVVRGRQN